MTVPTITVTYDTRAPKAQSIDLYSGDCVQIRAAILSDDGRGLYTFPAGATAELWVSAADDRPNDYFILAAAVLGNFLVALTDPAITDHLPTEPVLGWWVWREADGTQHTRLPVVFRRHYTPAGVVPAPAPENNFATKSDLTKVSDNLAAHEARTDNPHSVTAEQLGAVTSSTFMTELGNQAGLSIVDGGYTLRSDKPLSLSEYLTFSSSFATIHLQLTAGAVGITGVQGASSPYVLSINGDTETSGSVICNNSYRIKPQYLPVTQNRAAAESAGTTIYDLTSYQLQETNDTTVTLVDANGASVASFDKETGCIQAGDGSIHFNGSWPDSTAEVIEKDHLIRGNEIQGDKVGYPIYTVGDDGILKDRCINIVDTTGKTSWTAVFPESATAADFAIVYTCGCAPTFPDSIGFRTDASLEAFWEWSFVEGSTYLITFTQIGSTVYYASMRELQ